MAPGTAFVLVLVATPWVFALWLLGRAWRVRTGGRAAGDLDGPGRLLAAAAATLPDPRRDWGQAMTAELAQVRGGGSSRWRFAAGCARTALFPPRGSRAPLLAVGAGAVAAVAAAQVAVGAALPALRVFAVTFVALVGAAATLAVARSRRVRPPGPAVAAVTLAGVAGCIAAAAYVLATHPVPSAQDPALQVTFAVVLAGGVWLALVPPPGLASSRPARRFGVAMGVALAMGFLLASRFPFERSAGILRFLFVAPVVLLAGAAAAAVGRSFRAGVQAAVWAALAGTLLVFVVAIPEA